MHTTATRHTTAQSRTLRRALHANVALSTTTGVTALVGAPWLADALGLPALLLGTLGAGLLGFASLVTVVARRGDRLAHEARLVVVADLLWVIGAVPILASTLLTSTGDIVLAVTTAAVAMVAAAQAIGLRRLAT